jgi:hypothetical protein
MVLNGSDDGVWHSGLLDFGLCPSSGILKNTKDTTVPSPGERVEDTLLGPVIGVSSF